MCLKNTRFIPRIPTVTLHLNRPISHDVGSPKGLSDKCRPFPIGGLKSE